MCVVRRDVVEGRFEFGEPALELGQFDFECLGLPIRLQFAHMFYLHHAILSSFFVFSFPFYA